MSATLAAEEVGRPKQPPRPSYDRGAFGLSAIAQYISPEATTTATPSYTILEENAGVIKRITYISKNGITGRSE